MNNAADYEERTFLPTASNRFQVGFHGRGHHAQLFVRNEDSTKLRIDLIMIETSR